MQHLALGAFQQHRYLQMITAQIVGGATGQTTTQHRAGNNPVVARLHLAGGQLGQIGAQHCAQQAGALHLGATQGDDTLRRQMASGKQTPYGDHVLIIDMPDLTLLADRIEEVDMGSRQTRGMGTGEALGTHARQPFTRDDGSLRLAQPDSGQPGQYLEAILEVGSTMLQHHCWVGSQGMSIDGSDKNRRRDRVNCRHLTVGTGSQCGPESRTDQGLTHLLTVEGFQCRRWMAAEVDRLAAVHIEHHGLEHTLFAPVDRADHAGHRRGEDHPGGLLVAEQDLPCLYPITDLHFHRRFHTVVIETYQCNAARRAGVFNALLWRAGDWQIQAPFDFDHTNRLITFWEYWRTQWRARSMNWPRYT